MKKKESKVRKKEKIKTETKNQIKMPNDTFNSQLSYCIRKNSTLLVDNSTHIKALVTGQCAKRQRGVNTGQQRVDGPGGVGGDVVPRATSKNSLLEQILCPLHLEYR